MVSLPLLHNRIYNFYDMFASYLVYQPWLKQWKKYVGFESWDLRYVGKQEVHPGPADNFNLFKCILIIIFLAILVFLISFS